ncbi:hypothetical protein [Microbacterium trichothecenolyticum]|uniref:Uncharacterized protein n=1 Tax=Microbacterium trichothecenolyticum TaxID=69370 RepID=A0ABU0TXH3_MICTR|nr:hypothetical protein [Microbacterium trichothecenolyticum]MDQ1124349.1 hypothetical protein [Microbacterium trichothecenolyticum]
MSPHPSPSSSIFLVGASGLVLAGGVLFAVHLSQNPPAACAHVVVAGLCLVSASLYAVVWGALRLRRPPRPPRGPNRDESHAAPNASSAAVRPVDTLQVASRHRGW